MEVEDAIIGETESKRLLWFGHLVRLDDELRPKRVEKKKGGRSQRILHQHVLSAMQASRRSRRKTGWTRADGKWEEENGAKHRQLVEKIV